MDEAQIYARLSEICSEVFDQESRELASGIRMEDLDGWDSLSHVRLILTIEKTFKIKFLTAEMSGMTTVGDVVAAIKSRV